MSTVKELQSSRLEHLADSEADAICGHDTIFFALADATRRLYDRAFYSAIETGGTGGIGVMGLDANTSAWVPLYTSHQREWRKTGRPRGRGKSPEMTVRMQRLPLLQRVLDDMLTSRWNTRTVLNESYDVSSAPASTTATFDAILVTHLALWWDTRLSEGHDPESAQMLLGLTCSPDIWRHILFPADGPPTMVGDRAARIT